MQGGTGGCRPPARGSGGLEAPTNSRGSGALQPPSKNNFVDPEPGFWDQDLSFLFKKYQIWSEMGSYGSVGAHIKTGRSPMAQDHFKTLSDPPQKAME